MHITFGKSHFTKCASQGGIASPHISHKTPHVIKINTNIHMTLVTLKLSPHQLGRSLRRLQKDAGAFYHCLFWQLYCYCKSEQQCCQTPTPLSARKCQWPLDQNWTYDAISYSNSKHCVWNLLEYCLCSINTSTLPSTVVDNHSQQLLNE